jgi:DNA polymerase III delta subunit
MAAPTGGLYAFLGPDRALKIQRVRELERSLKVQSLDRHQLDAATLTGAGLLAVCRQQPAVSPVRLVVVDQAHKLDQATVDALQAHAQAIAATACVVLLVETELSVRHPLAKAGAAIKTERFTRPESAARPFALADALSIQDPAGALTAIHDQLTAGRAPAELFGLIAWQLNRWVIFKRLAAAGRLESEVAAVLGVKPWQAQRLQAEVSGRSLDWLERRLERCRQLDIDSKTGRMIPEVAVEQLVVELCS